MSFRDAIFTSAACCFISALPLLAQSSNKTALLIGIDQYVPPATVKVPPGATATGRFDNRITYSNLAGPSKDVDSIHTMLVKRFGFTDDPAHIHILLNANAKRQNIIDALTQYLVTEPHKGDTVVLYIASHGSLRPYPVGKGPDSGGLYYLYGTDQPPVHAENTIVPFDWYDGVEDILSRDLRHIFNQAANKKVHVTAIFDSCHSGSLARGFEEHPKYVARAFDYDPRPLTSDDPYPAELPPAVAPEMRTDAPVLVLSAALKDESAVEDPHGDPPHGLFTSALVEAVNALPVGTSANDMVLRVDAAIAQDPAAADQHPVLDGLPSRKREPLLGGTAGTGPLVAAALSVDASGVLLGVGIAQDIGPGSEFAGITGSKAMLRVTRSISLTQSLAELVLPAGVTPSPVVAAGKDIFQLTRTVPPQRPAVKLYAGASNPSAVDVRSAVEAVNAAVAAGSLKLVGDPSRDPWAHRIAWDGARWMLYAHSVQVSPTRSTTAAALVLGPKLSAAVLATVPAGSVVWFDVPLPAESGKSLQALLPGDPPVKKTELTADRSQADYVVGGKVGAAGPAYAWFKRKDLDAEVQTPAAMGAGCSPHSAYPLRTDFTGNGDGSDASSDSATTLASAAWALAKLYGWYQLSSSGQSSQSAFPYSLVLNRTDPGGDKLNPMTKDPDGKTYQDVATGGETSAGSYTLSLVGQPGGQVTPRWVYVIGIDCQGKGSVLWPYDGIPEARFPSPPKDGDDHEPSPFRIALPGESFPVGEPLGTDTYLLLTTSTKFANYNDLNFDPVVSRDVGQGRKGGKNTLEELLDHASAGTRGDFGPIPTDWSVGVLQTTSVPDPASGSAVGIAGAAPPRE